MTHKALSGTNYTIYIPEHPKKIAIYIHARMDFPHSKGRKGRTLYNFQEEVAEGIFKSNTDTIAVAAKYYKGLASVVLKEIMTYDITDVIVSGWSLGGNDALTLADEIYKQLKLSPKLLLIDSNHTNQISDKAFKDLKDSPVYYISNTVSKAKSSHISKVTKNGMLKEYLQLVIPATFKGSNHRYCRDSTISDNLYGYLFGGILMPNYKVYHWDPNKGELVR